MQPLGLAEFLNAESTKTVWRCHIDVSRADPSVWRFLESITGLPRGRLPSDRPHARSAFAGVRRAPAIDPLSEKSRELSDSEVETALARFGIDPPVIGGNVGGIRRQIIEGVNGYLVHSSEGLAWRLRELLGDPEKAAAMGKLGCEHVRQNFLLPHYLRDWLMIMLALEHPGESVIRLG